MKTHTVQIKADTKFFALIRPRTGDIAEMVPAYFLKLIFPVLRKCRHGDTALFRLSDQPRENSVRCETHKAKLEQTAWLCWTVATIPGCDKPVPFVNATIAHALEAAFPGKPVYVTAELD